MLKAVFRRLIFIAASFMAALLYLAARERVARRAARAAQAAQTTRTILEIKEDQDEAFAAAPHSRADLLERLRTGAF
ncbi:MAG: hypothetical protein ACPG42_11130 [Alphaproteobacteria bacterium]